MFHYTVETDKSVDDAVVVMEQSLYKGKFGFCGNLTFLQNYKGVENHIKF